MKVPDTLSPKQVHVQLLPQQLQVRFVDDVIVSGQLENSIKAEDSTWFVESGVLHIQLLKRSRKGHYADGDTNANAFWFALMTKASASDRLPHDHPPVAYYWSAYEADDLEPDSRPGRVKT
eukprot:jgi/Chrzof1/5585/Cz16g08060.t1